MLSRNGTCVFLFLFFFDLDDDVELESATMQLPSALMDLLIWRASLSRAPVESLKKNEQQQQQHQHKVKIKK